MTGSGWPSGAWATGLLFVLWYGLSGMADGINARVVKGTGLVITPCVLTFGISYVFCRASVGPAARPSADSMRAGVCLAVGLACLLGSMWLWDMQHTYAIKTSEALYTSVCAMSFGEAVSAQQVIAIVVLCAGSAALALQGSDAGRIIRHPMPVVVASVSNLALALRTVYAKQLLQHRGPAEVFRDVSLCAAVVLSPLCIVEVVARGISFDEAASLLGSVASGACYFGYNYFGFKILGAVSSSTYAVGKEMRCLCVYAWTLLMSDRPFTSQAASGAVLVVVGSLLYSLDAGAFASLLAPKPPVARRHSYADDFV